MTTESIVKIPDSTAQALRLLANQIDKGDAPDFAFIMFSPEEIVM